MVRKICAIIFCAVFFGMIPCSAIDKILVTTATDDDPWSLSIVQTDSGEYAFLIFNYDTEQAGLVPYNHENYNFYMNKSPLIFLMAVKDSPKDIDNELGEWRKDIHVIPIYALYNYMNDSVELESYLSSCKGRLSASHYQARIQSPYHIKLAEVFLTHMPTLHRVVESDKIVLP